MMLTPPRGEPTRRLLWVLPHPTPYNTYLLNGLASRLNTQVEAVFRWEQLPSHPWTTFPDRRFTWRIAAEPGGRDRELERTAADDGGTLIVFGGWRNRTMLPALQKRVRRRLPYAFWTDTPKVSRGPLRKLVNAWFCYFARRAIVTLATGKMAVERYEEMGLQRSALRSFPYLVDPDHFAPLEAGSAHPRDQSARFILCGRLVARLKGQEVAIRALALARDALRGRGELILAGSGPDETLLRRLAESLGVVDAIRFAGWTEYDRLPQLFWQCSALLMPSFWEPYGVALLEGMAAGLPVLASRACGAVADVVFHDDTGLIHDPGDVTALAGHMVWIASHPEEAVAMGKRARTAAARWDIDAATAVVREVTEAAAHR